MSILKPNSVPSIPGQSTYPKKIQPFLKQITQWKLDGIGNRDIAKKLGVAYSTFKRHVNDHPELKEALSFGIEELKLDLETTFWQGALYGTTSKKTVTKYVFDDEGNRKKVEETVHFQQNPPDGYKQLRLLTSHYGDKYREIKDNAQEMLAQENSNKYAEELLEKVSNLVNSKEVDDNTLSELEDELNDS